jgi:hypothetical protein
VKIKLDIGVHILAVPSDKECNVDLLFPRELSGSSIEMLDREGRWANEEIVLYQNQSFVLSAAYAIIAPLSVLKLTLKRAIEIDWVVQFESRCGLTPGELTFDTDYDDEEALYLSQLSKLVYEDEPKINQILASKYDFDDYYYYSETSHKSLLKKNFSSLLMAFFTGAEVVIDLQFMYLKKIDKVTGKNLITIVFRGSKEPEDWMTNFALKETDFLKRGRVHQGFYHSFQLFIETLRVNSKREDNNISADIFEDVDNFNETSSVILTGHSLGGALATLTSCFLVESGIKSENIEVYTFGAPPVGTEEFCDFYNNKLNIHRIVNQGDVVPKLDKFTPLFHFGKEIVLPSNQGEIHACTGYIDNIIDQMVSVEPQPVNIALDKTNSLEINR